MTDQDLIRGYQRTIEDLRLELARSHEALERIAALEPKLAEMLRSLGIVVDAENDGGWSTTAYMIRGFVSEADNIARAALQASSPTIPNQEMAWHVHTQPSDTEEVHVRIRDGRVTAMDGGPAPAAPSGATVVLHHDEEEEA